MKTKFNLPKFVKIAILALIGGVVFLGGDFAVRGNSNDCLLRVTKRELQRAQRATARYHNIDRAIADGYADINVFIPNMGYHYLNSQILDGVFDPERPELLVYADVGNGGLRLVAVEYAIPTSLADVPPEGFSGDADIWHRNDQFGLWTLHAWIWYHNPDGVFAESNLRVP